MEIGQVLYCGEYSCRAAQTCKDTKDNAGDCQIKCLPHYKGEHLLFGSTHGFEQSELLYALL